LAWHFCTDKNSKKLEKVQERALRFVYDDYTSSYMIQPTISLEMPVPSQGHYGFHSFPVVD
jgi:hypothetical protein